MCVGKRMFFMVSDLADGLVSSGPSNILVLHYDCLIPILFSFLFSQHPLSPAYFSFTLFNSPTHGHSENYYFKGNISYSFLGAAQIDSKSICGLVITRIG